MTTNTIITELTDWTHAARMAATICNATWDSLFERLPALDGYLPAQLIAAADRLHRADTAAIAAIATHGRVTSSWEPTVKKQRHQIEDAQEALAVSGYLHHSRVFLLDLAVFEAVAVRHFARGDLAELLFTARTVLEDAA